MTDKNITVLLEALLFALGKPLSRGELIGMLDASAPDLEEAIASLVSAEDGRGVVLVDDGKMIELRAASGAAELIEKIRREEFSRDLGRAGAEVLAILLYRGPSSRAQIDFIRGVNSSQALRTLGVRGLVRKAALQSERSVTYELTTELMGALGISKADSAPQYAAIRTQLEALRENA